LSFVAPKDVGVVSVGDDDELLVTQVWCRFRVLIVIGDTSPSAPEVRRPSAKKRPPGRPKPSSATSVPSPPRA